MTALDFPASPSDGDIYNNYVYDATRGVWNVYAQGLIARYTVSDTQPSPASNGDAWFDTTEGITYVYYDDGDTAQWVETGNPVLSYNTLENMTDTNIDSPANGQALVYDSATDKWINETPATTLDSLTDTEITTPADNEVLAYDNSSGDWINQTASEAGLAAETYVQENFSPKLLLETTEKTANYTLAIEDINKVVPFNSTSNRTLTIPTNASVAFPVGSVVSVYNRNTGSVTIAGAAGVTANATPGLKLRDQWSVASAIKTGTDEWLITGDLAEQL